MNSIFEISMITYTIDFIHLSSYKKLNLHNFRCNYISCQHLMYSILAEWLLLVTSQLNIRDSNIEPAWWEVEIQIRKTWIHETKTVIVEHISTLLLIIDGKNWAED
jgi:hypothetical protein